MHCSEQLDLRIRFRQQIFAFFILGFMDELLKPCERLKLPAVIRNTATDRERPIVYM